MVYFGRSSYYRDSLHDYTGSIWVRLALSVLLIFTAGTLLACSSQGDLDEDLSVFSDDETTDSETSIMQRKFSLEEYFSLQNISGVGQGAAVYGDYLFQATSSSTIWVYNMLTQQYVTTIKVGRCSHNDTLSFGLDKIEENDVFPILYLSGGDFKTSGKAEIYTYRIQHSLDNGNESFSAQLIQVITIPDVTKTGDFPDVVVDNNDGSMWLTGWLTNEEWNKQTGGDCKNRISQISHIEPTKGVLKNGVYHYTIDETDIMQSKDVIGLHAVTQGLYYRNGYLFCPYGNKSAYGYAGLDVLNVNSGNIAFSFDFAKETIIEPEAVVVYRDQLFVVGQKDAVYTFKSSAVLH